MTTLKAVSSQNSANENKEDKQTRTLDSGKNNLIKLFISPFMLLAIVPWILFAIYQIYIATPRYESQAQLIVQQPDGMATMDASMAILSGLGMPTSNTDTELVKAYIYSYDMLKYLNETLNLRQHYQQQDVDFFSRLDEEATREDFLEFYQDHLTIEIDDKSAVISVFAQAFNPDYALQLTQKLVERAEWYINEIGHQLANEQLKFIQGEHELVETKLRQAQTRLLNFQQLHKLLDPEAEGMAMQQITYSMEGQLATKEAELRALKGVMSESSHQVVSLENQVQALRQQLTNERQRLSENQTGDMSVSEVLAKFTDLKVDMELALKSYMSSQISLEKSRIEAYRQLKYLVVVESPTMPEDNKYPDVVYNITLFGVVILLLYGICNIIIATIRELG